MLDIEKKIEEIRQKPEHIRMRYVYGIVTVMLLVILFIWFLSIRVEFTYKKYDEEKNMRNVIDSLGTTIKEDAGKASLDDVRGNIDEVQNMINKQESLDDRPNEEN